MAEGRISNEDFWHEKLSILHLTSTKGAGFVIRMIDTDSQPPRFLIAAKQPGHSEIAATMQPAAYIHHPESSLPHRYYVAGKIESVNRRVIVGALLDRDTTPEVALALDLLDTEK